MRETPDQAVALMVARAMMPLRIGPMHGVQPAAKTTPITPARKGDAPPCGMGARARPLSGLILRIPATCRPMRTRAAPPAIRT